MKVRHCFDAVVESAIPPVEVVLGYVDGYATYPALVSRFKGSNTKVVSVTVSGRPDAQVADCEAGCMSVAETVGWVKSRLKSGKSATVYGTKDTHDAVIRGLRDWDIKADRVHFFLAEYLKTGGTVKEIVWPSTLPTGYVGWQFHSNIASAGHNLDASIVSQKWLDTLFPASHRFLPAGFYKHVEQAVRVA
jgi:hypothetical protein